MKVIFEIKHQTLPAKIQPKIKMWMDEFFRKNEFIDDINIFISSSYTTLFCNLHKPFVPEKLIRGPKLDCSEDILNKFLSANGIKKDNAFTQNGYFFFKRPETQIELNEFILEVVKDFFNFMLEKFDNPIDVNNSGLFWIRPVENITLKVDGDIFNLKTSYPIREFNNDTYHEDLKKSGVISDFNEREDLIISAIKTIEVQYDVKCISGSAVISENAGIYDSPKLHMVEIQKEFLTLPKELVQLVIESNQRYILFEKGGKLFDKCAIISEFDQSFQGMKNIKQGHAGVISARLNDGLFLLQEDYACEIKKFLNTLKTVYFAENLSVFDRIENIKNEYLKLFKECEFNDIFELLKFDLATKTVSEFTELQGLIGYYYVKNILKIDEKFAVAIKEQYGNFASNQFSAKVNIAEKLDYIKTLFQLGKKPTSSKDPFAIRQKLFSIFTLIINHKIDVDLGVQGDLNVFVKDKLENFLVKEYGFDIRFVRFAVNEFKTVIQIYTACIELDKDFKNQDFLNALDVYKRVLGVLENRELDEVDMSNLDIHEQKLLQYLDNEGQTLNVDVFNSFLDNCVINHDDVVVKHRRQALCVKILLKLEKIYKNLSSSLIRFI